jgi:predicted DNA-binding transcriptional regulator YafY
MGNTILINRLNSIDYFIQKQTTGNARDLAAKLGITERSVYNYLKLMKRMGAPIMYSITHQSYIYETEGGFFIGFSDKFHNLHVAL